MHGTQSHKNLLVWQKAVELASRIYIATGGWPDDERYGLARQIRHSAISVASNIAEGAARTRRADFIHFLTIARGSLTELETQVLIAEQLQLLGQDTLQPRVDEIGRMLAAIIRRLSEHRSLEEAIGV